MNVTIQIENDELDAGERHFYINHPFEITGIVSAENMGAGRPTNVKTKE